jgi:ABC-type nitrate/sulfonate/bicarbonate transport system permease component
MTESARAGVLWRWLAPSALILAALLGWEVIVRTREVPSWLLPPPSAVGRALIDDRALLFENALVTLVTVLAGFALALVAGVLLAVAIDASPTLDRAVYPLLVASQTVPVPALAPLLLIWFGYGLFPKVLVTALIAFFPIVVNTVVGLRSPDPETIAMLRTFGAGRWTRFRLVKAPAAVPYLFTGARIGAAVAVIGAVFGELVGAQAGLGYLLTRAMAQFQTARVVAAILLLSLMGIGLFGLVSLLERLLVPWRRDASQE